METSKSIQLIEEMIAQAKSEFSYNGVHYLLWGWLVLVAALMNYILLVYTDYQMHWIGWPVLMGLGGVITAILSIKEGRKKRAESAINRAINQVWVGLGLALAVVILLMPKIGIESSYPIFILLYAIGTFITGRVIHFRPLIFGGAACFALSLVASYLNFENQLLIIALAIIVSYIIPGHIMLHRFKKHV